DAGRRGHRGYHHFQCVRISHSYFDPHCFRWSIVPPPAAGRPPGEYRPGPAPDPVDHPGAGGAVTSSAIELELNRLAEDNATGVLHVGSEGSIFLAEGSVTFAES